MRVWQAPQSVSAATVAFGRRVFCYITNLFKMIKLIVSKIKKAVSYLNYRLDFC